jgi:ectoine hydroxylase-related dioxygenase (phytanoyl-CoA dioxygenase family)
VLNQQGFEFFRPTIAAEQLKAVGVTLFNDGRAGTRCLLDEPIVRETALAVRCALVDARRLPSTSVAIQAIAFDKTPAVNWKVTWHQDVMFPFARPVSAEGFTLASKKEGVDYARPPRQVLESLLAVRIHFDDCDETNGPLRVSSGTHQQGIIRSAEIAGVVTRHGETACLAGAGEALLMKPLLLHASSPATVPKHRRVLHLVYHSGEAIAEPWHRAV